MTNPEKQAAQTLVWDLPLRLFHWLLAVTLVGSWATQELGTAWMDWHVRLGYTALALVLFRLLWGFVGSRHARFASFLTDPATALSYARAFVAGRPPATPGHSALAGWAIVAMLLSVGLQAVSGLFQTDDFLIQGPWYHAAPEWLRDLMHEIHEVNINFLYALVSIHLTVIATYRWRLGSDIVRGMVIGRRDVPASDGIGSNRLLTALVAAAIAAGIVWAVVALAPQPDLADLF